MRSSWASGVWVREGTVILVVGIGGVAVMNGMGGDEVWVGWVLSGVLRPEAGIENSAGLKL
jgi:hypothetical protein